MNSDVLKKNWIGKRVISISNEFQTNPNCQPVDVGIVTDLVAITKSMTLIPMVKFDHIDEQKLCFSAIVEYSDELLAALQKLTPSERWSVIHAFVCRFQSR